MITEDLLGKTPSQMTDGELELLIHGLKKLKFYKEKSIKVEVKSNKAKRVESLIKDLNESELNQLTLALKEKKI